MKKRTKYRIFSGLLSLCLVAGQMAVPQFTVYADTVTETTCEHHEHDEECGYTESIPCNHEHDESCYREVTRCVHEHDEDCYSDDYEYEEDASPSDAKRTPSNAEDLLNCPHICDEDSGCITLQLDCTHEHDEECGYSEGTACSFNPEDCEICAKEELAPNEGITKVEKLQASIDELLSITDIDSLSEEKKAEILADAQALLKTYENLTEEEKEEITGLSSVEELVELLSAEEQTIPVYGWEWNDPDETLEPESGSLGLPGASETQMVSFDEITALLPASVTVYLDAEKTESKELAIASWECADYPEEGAYTGNFTFTAVLADRSYALAEGVKAFTVTVELGGGAMYAGEVDTSWYDSSKKEFTISKAEQLAGLAQLVNGGDTFNGKTGKTITLTQNIDLSDYDPWQPIGRTDNNFFGTFDGGRKEITGLKYSGHDSYVGLFGRLSSAELKNINLIAPTISCVQGDGAAVKNIGGIFGSIGDSGRISNCTVTGGSITGPYNVGGIGGYILSGNVSIENCSTNGVEITATSNIAGGLIGSISIGNASMKNCYTANCTAKSGAGDFGSLSAYINGTVENCYADGERLYKLNYGTLTNCALKSEDEFNSGEVAYLLQEGQENQDPVVWGQVIDLDGVSKDDYPVLGGTKVYQYTVCNNKSRYSNTPQESINSTHDFIEQDGTVLTNKEKCSICGTYNLNYSGISVSAKDNITAFTYNGNSQGPTYIVAKKDASDNLTPIDTANYDVTGNSGVNAGSYTAVITGTGNYEGTIHGLSWEIKKATPEFTTVKLLYDNKEITVLSKLADISKMSVKGTASLNGKPVAGTVSFAEGEIGKLTDSNGKLKEGDYTLSCTFMPDDQTNLKIPENKTVSLSIVAPVLTGIEVETDPKTSYIFGEYFDPTGMKVKALYADGTKKRYRDRRPLYPE